MDREVSTSLFLNSLRIFFFFMQFLLGKSLLLVLFVCFPEWCYHLQLEIEQEGSKNLFCACRLVVLLGFVPSSCSWWFAAVIVQRSLPEQFGVLSSSGPIAMANVGIPMKKHLVLDAKESISVEQRDSIACIKRFQDES